MAAAQANTLTTSLNLYATFCKKLLENITNLETSVLQSDFEVRPRAVCESLRTDDFKGLFIDFEYMNLSGKMKQLNQEIFYPINRYNYYRGQLNDAERKIFEKLILLLSEENSKYLNPEKIAKLRSKAQSVTKKRAAIRCFILTLFLYLAQKDHEFHFNTPVLEIIEELLIDYFPSCFVTESVDHEFAFFLLYICYEIYFFKMANNPQHFSLKLEKFVKSFAVWHRKDFWEEFLKFAKSVVVNPFVTFNVSLPKNFGIKLQVTNWQKIYLYAINLGFYLLKLPFAGLFDVLNEINGRQKNVPQNLIIEMSKTLEPNLEKNYSARKVSVREMSLAIDKEKAIRMCLKFALEFLNPKVDKVTKLMFLNKNFYKDIRKTVFKRILASCVKQKEKQVRLWEAIADCDQGLESVLEKLSTNGVDPAPPTREDIANIIRLDVRRTTFIKPEMKQPLENILLKTARFFSAINYYQGMNCIAGFLLTYTNSEPVSTKVFYYLTLTKLETYFRHNFAYLSKMLFICEKIIQKLNPLFDDLMQQNQVSVEFYLSSFLLTVFTTILQFVDCWPVIGRIFDCLISKGWIQVYKLIVYLTLIINSNIQGLKQDQLLLFLKQDINKVVGSLNADTLMAEVDAIPISKAEVRFFSKEYDKTKFVVNAYWNKFWQENKKGESKTAP